MTTRAQKIARLRNREYRHAFVASQISVGLPFQIRALREQRGWKQSRLASEAGMLQPRISAMESPGGAKFNLETLRRLASAFDVALVVRFVPFGELVDWSERFNPDTFVIPSFADDSALKEPVEEPQLVEAGAVNRASVKVGESSLQQLAMAKIGEVPKTYWLGGAIRIPEYAKQVTLKDLAGASSLGPWFSGPPITYVLAPPDVEQAEAEIRALNITAPSEVSWKRKGMNVASIQYFPPANTALAASR